MIVQSETMRPRATIIRVGDSEVDCLFTHLLRLVFNADILPRHHPCVGLLKSVCCPIICCPAFSSGTSLLPCGGMDAGWKPGGSKIGEKSSLLSDDAATSSSEDKSTPAACREVTCMRRLYAISLQIGVAFFFWCFAATHLAHKLHQERAQVVCSNKVARTRLAQRHPRNACHMFVCIVVCMCS